MPVAQPDLDGECFLVTGTGWFFRHALEKPNQVFGIVQLVDGGAAYRKVWGFSDGGRPTSGFATHLVAHAVRKPVSGGRKRIILHAHPREFIALSFLEPVETATLQHSRIISWTHHGILVSESCPDGVFALVETVEKAAAIHRKALCAERS
ncbi:class II aldolase/adducin family protein [Maliponia aquimaris]|uniref:Rhamnulose-1-phosphate aldolase n=1 Tax=Maliponia aquimaris TaxID=1673631 RepID=A0A238KPI8_9RHOB|nr:class II aldolase/adducin family protein [Maliponia aquimaris]SMX44032.1 Rhamnulose-1-phosphate aldolase [Maliponia aquimaris]